MISRISKGSATHRVLFLGTFFFSLSSLGLFLSTPAGSLTKENDANGYRKQALSFLQTGHLRPFDQRAFLPIHPPAFPLFASALFLMGNNSFVLVPLVHFLLALLSIFLLMRAATAFFDQKVGTVAFLLGCCNLGYLVYAQYLLMETIIVFFLTFFLERLSLFYTTKANRFLLQAGLLLGISVWIKPVALYYLLVCVPYFIVCSGSYFKGIVQSLFVFLGFCVPVLALLIMHSHWYNSFSISNTLFQNIYSYLLPQVVAKDRGISLQEARVAMYYGLDGEVSSSISSIASYLARHPVTFINVWIFNMGKTFFGLYANQLKVLLNQDIKGGDCSFFNTEGAFLQRVLVYLKSGDASGFLLLSGIIEIAWILLRTALLFLFFLYAFSAERYDMLVLLGLSLLYFVGITGHDGMARYRMMSEPFIMLMCAQQLVFVRLWVVNFFVKRSLTEFYKVI